MKMIRLLCLVLICVLILSAAAVTAAAAGGGYYRGDADGDGDITIIDVTVIQRWLADIPVVSFDEKAADVTEDGLDILDATWIQRFLAGIGDPYHMGEFIADKPKPTLDEYELPFIPD